MLSKSTPLVLAIVAVLLVSMDAYAQSGSRNAAPSFSPAPSIQAPPAPQFSAPQQYAPAATPSATVMGPSRSVVTQTPAPQPFTSGCPNCQLGGSSVVSSPTVVQPTYAPSAPVYSSMAPRTVYSAPVYSAPAPVYSAPVYTRPAPVYRPVIRSYAPTRRFYGGSCGGY